MSARSPLDYTMPAIDMEYASRLQENAAISL